MTWLLAMLGCFLVPLIAILLIAYAASDPDHAQASGTAMSVIRSC